MRKKIIFVFSLILLVFLIVNLLFRGGLFSKPLKKLVIQKLEQTLHASVTVENVRLNLFPSFLILNDFELKEASNDTPQLFKSKQVILSFSPWSFLTEYLLIHKIQIQNPVIHLIWNSGGKTNFDFLSAVFLRPKSPDQKSPVIIQKVIVVNGTLILDQNVKNRHASINHLELKTETDPTMTHFQITGSAKEAAYQTGGNGMEPFANLDWKLALTPQHLEIKRISVSGKEKLVTLKGIVNFPQDQKIYPFKLDSDFRFDSRAFAAGSDSLTGHGLFVGSYGGQNKINGNLNLSHLTLEKGKTSQNIGAIKSHFSFEPGLFFFDHFNSDLFGGKIEGRLKFQFANFRWIP